MSTINPEYFRPAKPFPGGKPCPFCGGRAELMTVQPALPRWIVCCHECRASTCPLAEPQDAVAFWNRRHGASADSDTVANLDAYVYESPRLDGDPERKYRATMPDGTMTYHPSHADACAAIHQAAARTRADRERISAERRALE
jgi:hypothetical protein